MPLCSGGEKKKGHDDQESFRGIVGFLQDRLISYAMVLSVGFLLVVSQVVSAVLAAVTGIVGGFLSIDAATAHLLDLFVSVAFITLLFAGIQLSQISPDSEAQSGAIANSFFPVDALLPPEVVA